MDGNTLERVREFRYLGHILTENDDSTRSIGDNLERAKRRWNLMAKVL